MNTPSPLRALLALACTAALAGVGTTCAQTAGAAPAPVRLAGSSAAVVQGRTPVGTVPATESRTVQIWMKPDEKGAAAYATAVSTPGSPTFHRYLDPDAYTARFAASRASTHAVASWLRRHHFAHVTVGAQRDYVRATGTVAAAESAFGVRIERYRIRTADGTSESITANDRAVRLPAKLAAVVLGITGLDNVQADTFHTARAAGPTTVAAKTKLHCSHYYGQHSASGLPTYRGATTLPTAMCGYTGSQLRQAYGMDQTATGTGQTIAFIEVGTPYRMEATLQKWASTNGLPAPKPSHYRQLAIRSGNECGNPFNIEEQLDIEAGYSMAPGAHQLLIGGDSCDNRRQGLQALFNADLAVVNGNGTAPYASLTSNSWGITGGETYPSLYIDVLHAILTKAAAEGVGMYFASGDDPVMSVPADDPFATAVGGTSLGLDRTGQRLFETGWSNSYLRIRNGRYHDEGISRSAAGGGTSLLWKEPTYQQGVVPASMTTPGAGDVSGMRAVPDISALADPFTGILQGDISRHRKGDKYRTFPDGGTSLAAPLVSGIVASAQQGRSTPFGFVNPVLYGLPGSALHDALPVTSSTPATQTAVYCQSTFLACYGKSLETFDSEDKAYTDQVTAPGYDTITGLGTPNGQSFIAALRLG